MLPLTQVHPEDRPLRVPAGTLLLVGSSAVDRSWVHRASPVAETGKGTSLRVSKKIVSLAAAGLLTAALAGCGSTGDDTASAGGETGSAPSTSVEEGSGALTQATFVERVGAAQASATTMHIESSYSGALAETLGLAGMSTPIDMDVSDPDSPQMSMSMSAEGMELSMILVDKTYYMSMGELTQGKYIKSSEEELMGDPAMSSFQSMTGSADPTTQLEGYKDAIVSFEASGSDVIAGTDVDLYTLVLDPAKVTGPQAEQLELDSLGEDMGEMTVVYAVDETDRPHRVEVTMTLDGQELVSTSEFSRWGEDLGIEVPPADQILEDESLM